MKKELIIISILISFVIILSGCGNNKDESLPTAVQKNKKNTPNALDYMAPGYKQAQDKIKQIQDIQQQKSENNYKEF